MPSQRHRSGDHQDEPDHRDHERNGAVSPEEEHDHPHDHVKRGKGNNRVD